MIVERGLLRILWQRALPATLLGTFGLSAYALVWPSVMTARDPWPALLVLIQCLLLAGLLGWFRSPAFAFIYSRGYTRDVLWRHLMLVSVLSIFTGWLPAGLIVWTGLRSVVHDYLFQSPFFPVMAPFETWVPLAWLALSVLLTPAFHYAWIRLAQPTAGGQGGIGVATGLMLTVFIGSIMANFLPAYVAWLAGVVYVAVLVTLILGGRALHRDLEVRA
jgi:hypothetical protein